MKEEFIKWKNNLNNNLLVISNSYRDFVKDQVEKLSDHFTSVTVLSRYNPISELSNILPIHYLEPFRKASLIDLSNKPYNINVTVLPIIYFPTDSGYKNLGKRHFRVTEKIIAKDNIAFDLIHSHFVWTAGYAGAKLKGKYDVPFVVTAHGYDIYDLPFRDEEWKEKIEYVLNEADYIITVSNSNLKYINKLNVKTPVKIIPNCFDKNLFYPRDIKECRKILNLPLDKKIILTVGNLVEIKGQRYLIEAIGKIVKHRKDILCIIVGNGELKNKLMRQIKKVGLNNYFIFAGERLHSEIPIWMNACNVFVLPSLQESFGVVQIEAMACGKPVIATKNGGSEEIIVNENYGLLCNAGNSEELSDRILVALDKKWNYELIKEYAKQFTLDVAITEILKIYEMLLP